MDINYFLRLQPGIENFSAADLDVFSRMLCVDLYPAKHQFTVRGEQGHAFYLIIDGAVSMTSGDVQPSAGDERLLRTGEWFGLLSLIENLPSFENCTSSESVTVASFNRAHFDELFELAPAIGRHFLYMLAKQLARTLIAQNIRLSTKAKLSK